MIQPKRIHEFATATDTELSDGTPMMEIEVLNGTVWRNRKTRFPYEEGISEFLLLETGDSLLLETGFNLALEQVGSPFFKTIIETNTANLNISRYYRLTAAGSYNLPSASLEFSGRTRSSIDIKNISGGIITIMANGSDTIRIANDTVTEVIISDGDFITLMCASLTQWDIN